MRSKLFTSCLLFILIAINCKAQLIFSKTYKDSSGTTSWRCLNSSNDSNYYFTGASATPTRKSDVLVVKTNIAGDKIWSKKYGRLKRDQAWDICENSNQLIIAGQCEQDTVNPQITTTSDICLLSIDTSTGTLTNSIVFGDSLDDILIKIIKTSDGNFIGVGYANRTDLFNGNSDALLVKFNSSLNILWTKTYSSYLKSSFNSIVESTDGCFYICGGIDTLLSDDKYDALIVKTDTSGNLIWSRKIDYQFNEYAHNVHLIDNSLYIGGQIEDQAFATFYASFIAKMDTFGNIGWLRKYYTNIPLASSNLYFRDNIFYITSSSYMLQVDTLGSIIASDNLSVSLVDLKFTKDNGFISACSGGIGTGILFKSDSLLNSCNKTTKIFYDSLLINISNKLAYITQQPFVPYFENGIYEIPTNLTTTVICQTASGVPDHETTAILSFYPNPVQNSLNIARNTSQQNSHGTVTLSITNQLGQTCVSKIVDFEDLSEYSINLKDLPAGMYFLSIFDSDSFHQQYKFIKE